MKYRFLVPVLLSIFLGLILGKIFFNEYDLKTEDVFQSGEIVYFVLIDKSSNKNDFSSYSDDLLYLKDANNYYVYGGISKNKLIAEKISKFYDNSLIEEKLVDNLTFLNILGEYDKVVDIASNKDDILDLEAIVMANYKELV